MNVRRLKSVRIVVATAMLVAFGGATQAPAPAAERPLTPEPAYYRPVLVNGFAFPVARSNWLSYLQFEDDWHEPRFRKIGATWELVGVHEGNDILAEEGTPIVAAAPGTIEAIGWTFYSGDRVGLRGDDGRYYFYAHLSRYAPGLAVGQRKEAGDLLGFVGNTGYGPPGREDRFPPHLHFGIEGPGGWENPYPLVARLYRAAVASSTRLEERLVRAGLDGDRRAFERVSGRLYDPALPPE